MEHAIVPEGAAPPLASEVAQCPPHHWLVSDTSETCRKCGFSRPLPPPPADFVQLVSARVLQRTHQAPRGLPRD